MALVKRIESVWKMSEKDNLSITIDSCLDIHPAATLILCHGLTGDKIGPQKLLSDLSFHLVEHLKTVQVVRFDFRGSGLSSGEFFNTTLNSMCEDAAFIGSRWDCPVIWMGISTGALIALAAAAERRKNESVIAISNGFAESILFTNLEESHVPLRGGQLLISNQFFLERSALNPRLRYFSIVGDLDVILGSNDEKHFQEYDTLQTAGARVHIIEKADHLFTGPKKRKELYNYLEKLIYEKIKCYSMSNCQK